MDCFQYLFRLSSVCKDTSNYFFKKMLNDFTCVLSHAVYLYFLTTAHRHCQMERLVPSSESALLWLSASLLAVEGQVPSKRLYARSYWHE